MFIFILGTVCSIGTAFLYIPQISTTLRTKTVDGLSLNHLLYSLLVCVLWLWYGFEVGDFAVICSQIALFLQLTALLICYWWLKGAATEEEAGSADKTEDECGGEQPQCANTDKTKR